jgi:hypothetical protein
MGAAPERTLVEYLDQLKDLRVERTRRRSLLAMVTLAIGGVIGGAACLLEALRRHPGFDPPAKLGNPLLRPLPVARHRAVGQALEDVLRMGPDVVVVPEVEGEFHGLAVVLTNQRLDVSRETGCAVARCHQRAPFPTVRSAVRKTVATSGIAPWHITPCSGWAWPLRT